MEYRSTLGSWEYHENKGKFPKKINLDNNKANVYNYVTVLQVKESITVLSRNVDRVFQKGKRAILSI